MTEVHASIKNLKFNNQFKNPRKAFHIYFCKYKMCVEKWSWLYQWTIPPEFCNHSHSLKLVCLVSLFVHSVHIERIKATWCHKHKFTFANIVTVSFLLFAYWHVSAIWTGQRTSMITIKTFIRHFYNLGQFKKKVVRTRVEVF